MTNIIPPTYMEVYFYMKQWRVMCLVTLVFCDLFCTTLGANVYFSRACLMWIPLSGNYHDVIMLDNDGFTQ